MRWRRGSITVSADRTGRQAASGANAWRNAGWLLLGAAAAWAGAVVFFARVNLHVARPMLLAVPALWLAWPNGPAYAHSLWNVARKITFLYLIGLIVLAGFPVTWEVTLPGGSAWRISQTIGFVALAGVGRGILHVTAPARAASSAVQPLPPALVAAAAVVLLHMLVLLVPLQLVYGYGWGQNTAVLSRLCLYLLTVVFMMPLADTKAAQVIFGLACGALFFLTG